MTIHLRKGEELVRQLHFHWADDWRSWLWAFLCLIAGIVNALDRDFLWMAVFLIASPLPLISRLYTQAFQACLITNKRIYLERGVFSKAKWDIPLDLLTKTALKQTWLQRWLSSGDMELYVGDWIIRCVPSIRDAQQECP